VRKGEVGDVAFPLVVVLVVYEAARLLDELETRFIICLTYYLLKCRGSIEHAVCSKRVHEMIDQLSVDDPLVSKV